MTAAPTVIGDRRELFVDDALIARREGVELVLQRPVPRDVAVVHDAPWEGNTCCYHTVFQDGRLYRLYYRGSHFDEERGTNDHPEVVCYAESRDGIHWEKPELGLVDFMGSRRNNIVWNGYGSHNFAPFRDRNPECRPGEEYKALAGSGREGLKALVSPDGVHWRLLQEAPVITHGAFDSQNLAFWDPNQRCYREYHRHFREHEGRKVRDIMTSLSADFRTWSAPEWLAYPGAPVEQLYTNAILPYCRAPHIYLGFPKRFVPERTVVEHRAHGVSDGLFMTSRDGQTFRRWGEAFIRPGLQPERWVNRNNMTAWGIVSTAAFLDHAPDELSLYSTEHYYRGPASKLRRWTVRADGFVAAHAPLAGGELVTEPVVFAGRHLELNFSTSAAGSVRVELQDAAGAACDGFALADCPPLYGDSLGQRVRWRGGDDVGALAGTPVRVRFALQDADLFAYRFAG